MKCFVSGDDVPGKMHLMDSPQLFRLDRARLFVRLLNLPPEVRWIMGVGPLTRSELGDDPAKTEFRSLSVDEQGEKANKALDDFEGRILQALSEEDRGKGEGKTEVALYDPDSRKGRNGNPVERVWI